MSVLGFASTLYLKTFNNSEVIQMGTVSVASNLELQYLRCFFYMNNVSLAGGSEQIRMKVFGDSSYSSPLYTSAWSVINSTTISGFGSSVGWLGWIRNDFTRQNMNSAITYYIGCEIGNYTRNASTFYCGLFYDFPYQIYGQNNNVVFSHNIAFQFFGYQARP